MILESFNYRMALVYFYKFLIIYVSFFSKNETIISRVLLLFLFSYFLRSTDLLSSLIFEGSIYFILLQPTETNFSRLSNGFPIYLECFTTYCSGEDQIDKKKEQMNKCLTEFGLAAIACGDKNYSLLEKGNLYFNPNTEPMLEASKQMHSGKCVKAVAEAFSKCIENAGKK